MPPHDSPALPRMDRRTAIKWIAAAAATSALYQPELIGAQAPSARPAAGYGTDPDLVRTYQPGDVWPLTFSEPQRATAATLCDTLIPADAKGPSASSLKVQDFIDEWISAPYPGHEDDWRMILTDWRG